MTEPAIKAPTADIVLERDVFLRSLLRELAGTLQDVVGLEASGYISVVGAAVGKNLESSYRRALQVERLLVEQIGEVLVDLKQRIKGDFFIAEEREDRIVLASRTCPFGSFVEGRPSLCMMTSNVFGYITAETWATPVFRSTRRLRVATRLPGHGVPQTSRAIERCSRILPPRRAFAGLTCAASLASSRTRSYWSTEAACCWT